MEKRNVNGSSRNWLAVMILTLIGAISFAAGIAWATQAQADEPQQRVKGEPRVVYPKRSELDFEGAQIEGEIRNPGEFYFQRRPEEKFDSLVKRRKNFHREMMRDVVLSK